MKMCVCVCLLRLLRHRPEGLHDHVGLVDELDGTHMHVYHSGAGEEKEKHASQVWFLSSCKGRLLKYHQEKKEKWIKSVSTKWKQKKGAKLFVFLWVDMVISAT